MTWPLVRRWGGYVLAWLVLSVAAALLFFTHSSRHLEVASHEAVVRPDFGGHVVLHPGAVIPPFRASSGSPIGVQVTLGQTDAPSYAALAQRYAAIAAHPDGQVAVVRRAVRSMALESALRGAAVGVVPLLVWAAVGSERRRALLSGVRSRRGVAVGVVVCLVAVGAAQPWRWGSDEPPEHWVTLGEFVGSGVDLPAEARGIEVVGDATTRETRRLLLSAVHAYQDGLDFYSDAAKRAKDLDLHQPAADETVVLLVSDRHDNIGMDAVARAIGDTGGATEVIDAGDDTSTGSRWEQFSLDSLAEEFDDIDHRWAVAGNHDHGTFVRSYLEKRGWQYFDDEPINGPGGGLIFGVDDPRSSGLGDWRDMSGSDFDDARQKLADQACSFDEDGKRVNTLLVHDTNLGSEALDRGCVDLVIGGHIHVEEGPKAVQGDNDEVGYRFIVGTTGGAAYAIAVGSKLRRTAGVALITYRDGRPVGIQGVKLKTTGDYSVDPYAPLTY